ncbi:MAG: PAN domain-containing protein [Polyangiales bacterium]
MSVPTSSGGQAIVWGDLEVNVNRLGSDYKVFDLAADDPELCRDACEQDARCRAFTYVKPGIQGPLAKCWLKDPAPAPRANEGCCVSGIKP